MRERITFVQKLGDSLESSALRVGGGAISGPDVHAVREDRLTIALHELPSELRTLLRAVHELHIRWVGAVAYETVSPLLARLPPGFHVFFTPGEDGGAVSEALCPTLDKIFGDVTCSTPAESFTSLPRDRWSHAAALQYFQQLDSLAHFIQYAKGQLCREADASCSSRLDSLSKASSLDISYDAALQAVRVTALWPYQRQPVHATSRPQLRTEVGILSDDRPRTLEPHEVGMSGLLTVLGQDSKPSPTMFTFAARHRAAESAFSARFLSPTGLHPTLQLRLTSNLPPPSSPPDATCTLHAYLTLPRGVFADKYQLADPLFLASKNLSALRHTTQPVDLEAPAYALDLWGSAILLDLAPPRPAKRQGQDDGEEEEGGGGGEQGEQEPEEWTAEIPLHLRYQTPASGGYARLDVPYPAVFWACAPDDEHDPAPAGANHGPFDRVQLGYDSLFGPRTVFWHVEPRPALTNGKLWSSSSSSSGLLINSVRVPVLDLDRAQWVGAGTAAAVLAGFAWVVWKLVGVYLREGYGARSEGKESKEKKEQ